MGIRDWLRGRRAVEPNDLLSGPASAILRSTPATVPPGYATVLVGDVTRIQRLAGFADSIDQTALTELTSSVAGIGEQELVGVISRPGGAFRWDPHPSFARVGVQAIEFARDELSMIAQPGPTSTRAPAYTLILQPFQELQFRIVSDLDLN